MNFLYEALDQNGQTVLGKMEAHDATDVQRQLQQAGYRPQSIAPTLAGPSVQNLPAVQNAAPYQNTAAVLPASLATGQAVLPQVRSVPQTQTQTPRVTLAGNAARLQSRQGTLPARTGAGTPHVALRPQGSPLGGVSTRDMMLFFQQFASLVRSGMTIYASLENLAPRTKNANLAKTAQEMSDAARTGGRISDVMANYPRIYPDHIVGMVRAGELGGFLEICLAEIALTYEQNIALYRGAWIPKAMATQAFFILPLAIPLFTTLFRSFDFQANLLLYFKQVGFFYLPAFTAAYFGAKWGAKRFQLPQYRYKRDSLALKMPPFGDLQRQAALANFVRMLRRLTNAGVAPIQAWEGAMNTASNVVIRDRLASSYALMQQGASLGDAFAATGLFHNSIENLIITGQQSGQVVEMLDQAAEYYQEQVEESSRKAKFMMLRIGVLAMLIFGGGALLWLAKSYFGGIFHLVDTEFAPPD